MRAIILVGGFGTRLRPLTLTIPKQMLPVVEVPMIERKIAHLVAHGIDDVVLSMGYKPDAFQAAYPDNRCAGAKLTYVIEPEPLDTAGAIGFAARAAGIDETFLALNGDTLVDLDFGQVIELHRARRAEGTIALTPVDDPSRFGVVPTDESGRVEAFIEKPSREEAPTNLINGGTYVLEPAVLDRIEPGKKVSIEREVFPAVVADGKLYAGHFGDYWLDIGTPEAYIKANTDVLDREFAGEGFVGKGAKVSETAVVSRSVVGAGASVGDGVTLIDSVILPGAVIGANATIGHSVVAEKASVGDDADLHSSIVGAGCAVGAGVLLRDEKVNPTE